MRIRSNAPGFDARRGPGQTGDSGGSKCRAGGGRRRPVLTHRHVFNHLAAVPAQAPHQGVALLPPRIKNAVESRSVQTGREDRIETLFSVSGIGQPVLGFKWKTER